MIDNQGSSASFEIHIPRTATRVEIWVNQARLFLKDGPHVTGPSLVPLTPAAP